MKTLKEFTDTIRAAGCFNVKMERSYKRRDHRETLVCCYIKWRTKTKLKVKERDAEGKAILADLVKVLTEEGFELTSSSWEHSPGGNVEIWVQGKVAPSDQY